MNDIDPNSVPQLAIESNARFVEWSDGTCQLIIGNEEFDVNWEDIPNSGVFMKIGSEVAILKSTIDKKIFVKPNMKSKSHVASYVQKRENAL